MITSQNNSANHHWWPIGLQTYWQDHNGRVQIVSNGEFEEEKNPKNGQVGMKRHGHTIARGNKYWETNYEHEFDSADNDVHNIMKILDLNKSKATIFDLFFHYYKKWNKKFQLKDNLRRDTSVSDQDLKLIFNFLISLLVRSPRTKRKYIQHSVELGFPEDDEIGKGNALSIWKCALRLIENGHVSQLRFILLHAYQGEFLYSDGLCDHFTHTILYNQFKGHFFVPLTPDLAIYVCSLRGNLINQKFLSLWIAHSEIAILNEITQVYSDRYIYYRNMKPHLSDHLKEPRMAHLADGKARIFDELERLFYRK